MRQHEEQLRTAPRISAMASQVADVEARDFNFYYGSFRAR